MPALVHHSLAPEILLTVVSTFSVGFLLWFLVGLLREARRTKAGQLHILRFTGGKVLNFEPRSREGTDIVPPVAGTKITGEAGKIQVFRAPDPRSPKDAVKIRWLLMGLLVTATVPRFGTPPPPSRLPPAAESPASPVAPIVSGPLGWPIREVESDGITSATPARL